MPYPLANSPRKIYHTLNPHPALSPVPEDANLQSIVDQEQNEELWRQLLVQGVLAVILPQEDLENGCLRALVAEIMSEMIVGQALSNKACEPWLLWEVITRVLEATNLPTRFGDTVSVGKSEEENRVSKGRLEHFGLLSASKTSEAGPPGASTASSRPALGLFWLGVQYLILAFTAARSLIVAVASSSSLPARSQTWPVTPPVGSESPGRRKQQYRHTVAPTAGEHERLADHKPSDRAGATHALAVRLLFTAALAFNK